VPRIKEAHYWDTVRAPHAKSFVQIAKSRQSSRFLKRIGIKLFGSALQKQRETDWDNWLAALSKPDPMHSTYADFLFHGSADARVVGECTPAYAILAPSVLAEIAQLSPNTKFLFLMRDPVDRVLAGVRHRLRRDLGAQNVTPKTVNDAIDQMLTKDQHSDLARSRYDLCLANIYACLPKDRVAVLFFETMFQQSEVDRVTDFLGVARQTANFGVRSNQGVGGAIGLEPALADRLRGALSSSYAAVRLQFGDLVPKLWHQTDAPTNTITQHDERV
jgi:hypothetical protein